MKKRLHISPVGHLSMGVISLIASLALLIDSLFGIFPEKQVQQAKEWQLGSRVIGDQVSVLISKGDWDGLQVFIDRLVSNGTDIDSIGIRQADETLVAASRNHSVRWAKTEGAATTSPQLVLPLYSGSSRWGEVEVLFADQHSNSIVKLLSQPSTQFFVFLSSLGLLFVYFYLRRALHYLDPADSVPQRVRVAFDTLTESVLVLDVKERIMLANASFMKLVDDPEMEGKRIIQLDWLTKALRQDENLVYPWQLVLRTGQTLQGKHLRITLPNGSRHELIMNCSAISDGSSIPRGCLVSFEDVTPLSRANAELAETVQALRQVKAELLENNRELARVNKLQEEHQSELTRFLAVASHDLRQPMHSLNLYLGALSNHELPDPAISVLNNVRRCAGIMDNMFLALLDLSRLDAQVVAPHVERFPISSLLSGIAIEFAPQARSKGLDLHVVPCSVWVESDAALIEQILRNLVANAIRYTERGKIVVGCRRKGNRLRLAVYDTGIGIPLDQQKTVFEEFCQLGNASRDRTKGLGLGLAIVRRLARLLATPITLVSSPGKGSTFAIDVLRCEASLANDYSTPFHGIVQSAASKPATEKLLGKLVVVVDDEESILDAMRVLLEQWGCGVVTATSEAQAIEKLGESTQVPDVLVCDYQLRSSETGMTAAKALQSEFNSEIPVLIITGTLHPGRMQEMIESGMPVLHKPVNAETLKERLLQLMEKKTTS